MKSRYLNSTRTRRSAVTQKIRTLFFFFLRSFLFRLLSSPILQRRFPVNQTNNEARIFAARSIPLKLKKKNQLATSSTDFRCVLAVRWYITAVRGSSRAKYIHTVYERSPHHLIMHSAKYPISISKALPFHKPRRCNLAHRQCAKLQRARRHAKSASPMGGVLSSQVYWAEPRGKRVARH